MVHKLTQDDSCKSISLGDISHGWREVVLENKGMAVCPKPEQSRRDCNADGKVDWECTMLESSEHLARECPEGNDT